MFTSKKVTQKNARDIEEKFKKIVVFSVGEDGSPTEISVSIPGTEEYLIIRNGGYSGQLNVDLVSNAKNEVL